MLARGAATTTAVRSAEGAASCDSSHPHKSRGEEHQISSPKDTIQLPRHTSRVAPRRGETTGYLYWSLPEALVLDSPKYVTGTWLVTRPAPFSDHKPYSIFGTGRPNVPSVRVQTKSWKPP